MTEQQTISQQLVQAVNEAEGRLETILAALEPALRRRGSLALVIASTAVSDLEGFSAAGATPADRRLTPTIDAECLLLGRPLAAATLPASPRGIVSPVVLSRAMLPLLDCSVDVFDCGVYQNPGVPHHSVSTTPGGAPDSGRAMAPSLVSYLYNEGRKAGARMAAENNYLVIGECVPGGTTTALGVLMALGYPAASLVSGSLPRPDNALKAAFIERGLRNASIGVSSLRDADAAWGAMAAVGDPMQPFVCGMALEASLTAPVILGGGTQMLAVYALCSAIAGASLGALPLVVMTTKWVAFDNNCDVPQLARLVGAPCAASCPDFYASRHAGLRAYEEGNVKEGVGAGAMLALAALRGFSAEHIGTLIDDTYDLMVS